MATHPPPPSSRSPAVILLPPAPSPTAPATLIFLHGYNSTALRFNSAPPNSACLAHHIHDCSPSLQHVKIIIPNGLPCVHPTVPENVWYNLDIPFPKPGDAKRAYEEIEYGSSKANEKDMEVTMDYLTSLIEAEIAQGTPANRIVLMGFSQGATMVALFILTRKLAGDLGAVISFAGFSPAPMTSVARMQTENGLEGEERRRRKTGTGSRHGTTVLFLLHGSKDPFVPLEIYHTWLKRLEGFSENGQGGIARIDGRIIEGMDHRVTQRLWPETRRILEMVVPQTSSSRTASKM